MFFRVSLFLVIFFYGINLPAIHPPHAIYFAVIQIKKSASMNEANMIIKVFTDDLENALKNEFPSKNIMIGNNICEGGLETVESYFFNHLQISINEKIVDFQMINCQQEADVYFFEFKMKASKEWKKIKIKADFFMELFPTQSNMVNLIYGGYQGYCRLTKKESSCEVLLN